MFFVDKRHWPDLVLLQCFFVDKGHWPDLVLLQCFLRIRGTGLHWCYYNIFVEALAVLSCSGRSVTVSAVIFSVISFVFSLQMFVSDHGWMCIPVSVKPDLGELISILLKSKADSTTKRYKKEILQFIEYCNFSGVRPVPPFPVAFIVAYLFKVYKSSSSYASLVDSRSS